MKLPTTDQMLERMIAQHSEETDDQQIGPSAAPPVPAGADVEEGIALAPERSSSAGDAAEVVPAPVAVTTAGTIRTEAEPEPPSEAADSGLSTMDGMQAAAAVDNQDEDEQQVEVVFRVADIKGVAPFSHHFAATSTTAQVHAYLIETMEASGMGGSNHTTNPTPQQAQESRSPLTATRLGL